MKMTKKIAAIAACATMALTSMTGMCASAAEVTADDSYIVSGFTLDGGIMPCSVEEETLRYTGYQQEKSNWCWVACAQTALKFVGKTKTQTEIYKAAKGTDVVENNTGTFDEINKAIKEFDGTTFTISSNSTFNLIRNRIRNDNIVIIRGYKGSATVGHDIICYGYKSDPDNSSYTLYIYDPSSTDGGEGTLTCSGLYDTSYTWKVGSSTKTYSTYGYMYGN